MREQLHRSFRLGALASLTAAAFLTLFSPAALAQDGGAIKIRVATVDNGFKCDPAPSVNCLGDQDGDFVIQVPQGSLIEVTFVWSHLSYPQEEHIILLEGYKLETDKLTSGHREETITFIADMAGSFNLKCDLECDVHDLLQRGQLKVSRGGAASAPSFTKTSLSLTPSLWVTIGDPVQLMAVLTDVSGKPVPKSGISFVLNSAFAGTTAKMALGEARTDANGVAFFEYRPTLDMKQHAITASYEGGGIYDGSGQSVVIEQLGPPPLAYETEPPGLEGFRVAARRGLFAGAIAVWVLLGAVILRAVSIVMDKPEAKTL